MRKFLIHFITAIAALSSIATLITFCSGWTGGCSTKWYVPALAATSVIVLASGYALFQIRTPKKIMLPIAPGKLNITLQEADLFKQKGIIVIGFNEYFDTHVGDGVVSEKSLHGIFINKYFKDRTDELYQKITESLAAQNITPTSDCPRRTKYGRTNRYPIGTCAKIRDGENIYVLVALSHFNENDKANLTREEYNEVIGKLMSFLEANAETQQIHMPILGSGLTRLDRTEKRILHYMIDSIDFQYSKTILGGLFIDIISLKTAGINLNHVRDTFKNGIIQN